MKPNAAAENRLDHEWLHSASRRDPSGTSAIKLSEGRSMGDMGPGSKGGGKKARAGTKAAERVVLKACLTSQRLGRARKGR